MKRLGIIFTLYILISTLATLATMAQDTRRHDDHNGSDQDLIRGTRATPQQLSAPSSSSLPSPLALGVDSLSNDSLLGKKSKIKKPKDVFEGDFPSTYAWTISPRYGDRILAVRDTSYVGFNQTSLVDGRDVAVHYQGNIGTAAHSAIFFNRPDASHFIFLDAYSYWHKTPDKQLFLNTKTPYSNIYYQSAGGKQNSEEHFKAEMSTNVGKKINFGFDFDYLYTRGFYSNMANKQLNYDFYGSYIGDKYKMHAFLSNNNFTTMENGGITDDRYITNPVDTFSVSNSKDIPVHFSNTWNKMRGRNLYVTNRYDLGQNTELRIVNDSTTERVKKEGYVSPASVIFTTHYTDQIRRVHSDDGAALDKFYQYPQVANVQPGTVYPTAMNDQMAYWSFRNTLALSMNEGFRSWTKFGLTAFVEYEECKYALTEVGLLQGFRSVHGESAFIVGGVLSKEQGENLLFNISAEKDFLSEDFKIQGEITGKVNLFGKSLSAKAKAHIKSLQPTFFERRFGSKYFKWDNPDLSNVHRVYVGGEITLPSFAFSRTKISGGVENIENHIYYGTNRLVQQSPQNIQIVSVRLDQELQAGILHWDNSLVYQMTADDKVIPLPDLSAYTNLYISAKVAKVLSVDLGIDAHFHTKYYTPAYELVTMQFYNQREKRIGSFPIATAYANLNLKNTRFFVMMYNILDGVGDGNSFSMLHTPVNPRILKFGLSWKFNN